MKLNYLNHHDWKEMQEKFEKMEFRTWVTEYISEIDGKRILSEKEEKELSETNKWNIPIELHNPDVLALLFDLNKRIEELKERIHDLERK